MNSLRFPALAVFLLILTAAPGFGQVCTTTKYQYTMACLPTVVVSSNFSSNTYDVDPKGNYWNSFYQSPFLITPSVPFAIGAQYAMQVATAPSAATATGYIFSFKNGALSAKPADLGPFVSDPPQTLGKQRMFVGVSYQYMNFTKTGGKNVSSIPFAIEAEDEYFYGSPMSLDMQSLNTYVAYGVTNRLDLSVIIPWSRAAMTFSTSCPSKAQTYNYYGVTSCTLFDGNTGLSDTNGDQIWDAFIFGQGSESLTSQGIGDVTVRGKYELKKTDHQGLAVGLEYRLPTGDPLNFRGSGATGVRPFLSWGYNGRISPHANIGFQYNGSSKNEVRDNIQYSSADGFTYSDTLTATKLPDSFTATVGADFAVTRRLNLDADLLERVFSDDGSSAFKPSSFPATPTNPGFQAPVSFTGVDEKSTVILGAKGKLTNHLLFGASVMIDASNNGLSYSPSPMVTVSYDFGTTK